MALRSLLNPFSERTWPLILVTLSLDAVVTRQGHQPEDIGAPPVLLCGAHSGTHVHIHIHKCTCTCVCCAHWFLLPPGLCQGNIKVTLHGLAPAKGTDALQASGPGPGGGMVPSSGLTAPGLGCPPGLSWGQVEVNRSLVARLFFGAPCHRRCRFGWTPHLSKCLCGLVWPREEDGSSSFTVQATSEDQACN